MSSHITSSRSERWIDQAHRLERIACRAPSAHNTQPWRLAYLTDRIRLDFDPTKHLESSDPTRRDLLLSLGTYVEAILIAGSEAGIHLNFRPDVDIAACRVGLFFGADSPYSTLFTSRDILNRQTSRLPYRRSGPIDDLTSTSLRSCLTSTERIVFLRGSQIRDLLVTADRHLLDTPPVAAELRRWCRLTAAEAATADDGLTADCLALGGLEARLFAWLLSDRTYPWFRRLRLSALVSSAGLRLVPGHANLIAFLRRGQRPSDWLDAGRSLMRLWLRLGRAGFHVHPLSQVLDCPETLDWLRAKVGCSPDEEVMSLFRYGTSDPPAKSRRRGEGEPDPKAGVRVS